MKKISIYMLALLGMMGASSCKEEIEPAMPQQNPQEAIFKAGDIESAKEGALEAGALKLDSYTEEGAKVPVLKLEADNDMPAGATVTYYLDLSDTEDFHRHVTLETTADADGIYSVSASDWNAAHVYLFGKSPKEKTAYYRVPAYVSLDGTEYRYVATDYYVESGIIKESCMDMGFVIEDHYYLLGNMSTWDMNLDALAPYAFTHESDADVYDDPVFVINFEVTQEVIDANGGGCYWKIAPQSCAESGKWDGVFGPETNGDESLTGHLVNEKAEAGKIVEPGKYKMTVNFETLAYEIQLLLQPEFLYTPGDANGWSQTNSAYMQLEAGKFYYGVFPVTASGFKICEAPDWSDATTWGATVKEPAASGKLALGGAGKDILAPEAGLYWVTVKFDTESYALTTYEFATLTKVGLIGSFAASSWNNDVEMTSEDGGKTWTGTIDVNAGDKFKVRFNGNWDHNLGGEISHLTSGGSDIAVEEAGLYEIKLNLNYHYPSLTMTKK